jgi:hypothetical protein
LGHLVALPVANPPIGKTLGHLDGLAAKQDLDPVAVATAAAAGEQAQLPAARLLNQEDQPEAGIAAGQPVRFGHGLPQP